MTQLFEHIVFRFIRDSKELTADHILSCFGLDHTSLKAGFRAGGAYATDVGLT